MPTATHTEPKTAALAPAAAPTGSQPAEPVDANTEHDVGEADIMAALAQFSAEPQKAEAETAENEDAGTDTDKGAEPAAEADDTDAATENTEVETEADEAAATPPDEPDVNAAENDSSEAVAEATPPAQPDPKRDGRNDRIDELTARLKAEQQARAAEQERLAALEAEATGPLGMMPLDHIETPAALKTLREQVLQLRQKLYRSPNGLELPDKTGKPVQYSAEQVADMLAETDRLYLSDIPERERYLASLTQAETEARKLYPWLADVGKGYGEQVHKVVTSNPSLRKLGPNYRLIAADALIGQTLRDAGIAITPELVDRLKAEAARKPVAAKAGAVPAKPPAAAPVRRVPPAAPQRAGVIPAGRSNAVATNRREAEKRLQKSSGSERDVANLLAQTLNV